MSTRGIIARPHGQSWRGRYHHWDSYPAGLGAALWQALHGHFEGDVDAMLRVLLDEHPAGWSTIVDADWTLAPGFEDYPDKTARPKCYCHGTRAEAGLGWVTPDQDTGAEWAYILDAQARTMTILEARTRTGTHAVGMFGSNPGRATWREVAVIGLDGDEPKWKRWG